jgi:hypothetical protein
MGFTYDAMLNAIFIINTSICANHACMALGWFGANLVVDPLLVAPFAFWPLPENLGTSPHFPSRIDLATALDEA